MKNHLTKKQDEIHEFDFRNLEVCTIAGDWENTKLKGQERCLLLKTNRKMFQLYARNQIDRDIWVKAFVCIVSFFQQIKFMYKKERSSSFN
jgi:hypothetical protein